MVQTAEHQRLTGQQRDEWHRWGTYLASRAWGTVREDYTPYGKAWEAFPFEQANSRAYRWTEDGIGGVSDARQFLCMAPAFWNSQDPFLKERFFGLGNEQGSHGEDVKDYFFYLDGLPSYSYMKALYKYPQVEFPYVRIVQENAMRGQDDPTFGLIDALPNTFAENRYFDIYIEYAKASPDDILCRITAVNRGDEPAPLHLLPQVWFRNTWAHGGARPVLRANGKKGVRVEHPDLTVHWWYVDAAQSLLFTENETNTALLFDTPNPSPYVKDGIHNAIVRGRSECVNPDRVGTKCAAHCFATVEAGGEVVVRTRLQPSKSTRPFADFDSIFDQRVREADEFYSAVQRDDLSDEDRHIQRGAFTALNWNKNFYNFNVKQWLEGDPGSSAPERPEKTHHQEWSHFDAHDVISIPDPWEYPWLAAWDLDFQMVTLSLTDAEFAKRQVLLLLDDRYMRQDGAMPAFEGDFSTPHPPIHAWATLHVYKLTGRDVEFLRAAYEPLKRNFDWWLKTEQRIPYLFTGGFMGMDNISLIDRTNEVPEGAWLAQADATGWMALYALNMLAMAVELERDEEAITYLEHFLKIRDALAALWDEETGFLHDVLFQADGTRVPLKVRSLVGLVPLVAANAVAANALARLPKLRKRIESLDANLGQKGSDGGYLLAALPKEKIVRVLKAVFDPGEFDTPHGLRSVSKVHQDRPAVCKIGEKTHELRYVPGEAADKVMGGNSNWRGPIWAPLNHLMVEVLYYYHGYFGDTLKFDGTPFQLEKEALALVGGLTSLFKRDEVGCRPYFGGNDYFQNDPHWQDLIWFFEHFHAENGAGLGATHLNGWTALIAKLIQDHGRTLPVAEA